MATSKSYRTPEPVTGIIITLYDPILEPVPGIYGTVARKELGEITFEPIRVARFTYRFLSFRWGGYWTSELSPPEIGADSALELGLLD